MHADLIALEFSYNKYPLFETHITVDTLTNTYTIEITKVIVTLLSWIITIYYQDYLTIREYITDRICRSARLQTCLQKIILNANISKSFSNFELSMLSFYSPLLVLFVIRFLAQLINVITNYKAFFLFYKMT